MKTKLKFIRAIAAALAFGTIASALSGCEDNSGTVTHKITFHNKSSYTVTQKLSGYGTIAIAPGDKRAFDDSSMTMYGYEPKAYVIRVTESQHTVVYKNR